MSPLKNKAEKTGTAADEEWDDFIVDHSGGHHEQSSRYGRLRELYGYKCRRVVLRRDGKIAGGAQILVQPTPIGRLALLLRGPLAADDDPALMAATVAEIDELAREQGYTSLRVELLPGQTAAGQALQNAGFATSTAWFGQRPSLVVPLTGADDQLLATMKPKGRYNIRLAERNGVVVRAGDETSLNDFYRLYLMTAAHQKFPVFPREYFVYLWRLFGSGRRMQLFLAWHHDKPVAAVFNALVAGRMYYCFGGMHRGPAESRLMANYLLHFRAMTWAREHGCSHYELVGVTSFKSMIAHEMVHWPLPLRKYYGPARRLRRRLTALAWENAALRKTVKGIAWKLGLTKPLPW